MIASALKMKFQKSPGKILGALYIWFSWCRVEVFVVVGVAFV